MSVTPQLRNRLVLDFVADDAADDCATERSGRAVARQNGAFYSTDGGILALRRHPGTSTQTKGQAAWLRRRQ